MSRKSKITINEIAKLASTSKTTVSFFLNGKFDRMSLDTKERIAKVIKETNYRPSPAARSLNSMSMKLIGVIIGDITNTFANQIVKGIDDIASNANYQIIVGNSNYDFEKEEIYVDRMIAMGVDGFIIQPTTRFHSLIDKIKSLNKEIVFIDSQTDVANNAWVKTNNYEAVLNATDEMIEFGYEDFVMLTADPSILSTRQERSQGFIDALELKGKKVKTFVVENDVTSEEISDILHSNLKLNSRTLIFSVNCWLLPIVYLGLKDLRKLIPSTIGLLGFDNTEWSNFSAPSVTTIVQPSFEEGQQACKILIDKIESTNIEAPQQILKCTMNWMESTANN